MTGTPDRRRRWRSLLLLAGLGLAVGILATRVGRRAEPAMPAAVASPPPAAPPARGSSLSVVGGMTPEEAARLGIRLPENQAPDGLSPDVEARDTAPLAPPAGPPPEAMLAITGLGGEEGPPVAAGFPAAVREAAVRYLCLCGCPHRLDECPCRDQPIGAGTMLAHLERHLRAGGSIGSLDAAMAERYGERVFAPGVR